MLLYGAARDPATCKPTKDSEIAAARLQAPRFSPAPVLPLFLLAHVYPLSILLLIVFSPLFRLLSHRRSEKRRPANIVTYSPQYDPDDRHLARSSGKVAEVAVDASSLRAAFLL